MPAHRLPLTAEQILAWADAHRARAGKWPSSISGAVEGAGGLTWAAVDAALRQGCRGLPGGSSLPGLLRGHRGAARGRPPLTVAQVLAWADAHRGRTGAWPAATSGEVAGAPGENWRAIDKALCHGFRGLPAVGSLARLLDRERGSGRGGGRP